MDLMKERNEVSSDAALIWPQICVFECQRRSLVRCQRRGKCSSDVGRTTQMRLLNPPSTASICPVT